MDKDVLILENSMGDLKISSVADLGFFKAFQMSPELHAHSYYEILLALEGGLYLALSDGEGRTLGIGDLCLIPPGVYHGTCPLEESSKKLALRFRYERESGNDEALYRRFCGTLSACKDVIHLPDERGMVGLIDQLREEILEPGSATKEYTETLLNQFYLLLMRRLDARQGLDTETGREKAEDDREERRIWIEDYFQEFYGESITEEHMAEKMNLSKRQVSRVLSEIYGKSFRQLLIECRLNRAAQLLLSTEKSVEEIAFEVGYTSLSGFYSAFRQGFGVSAGKYRKNIAKHR